MFGYEYKNYDKIEEIINCHNLNAEQVLRLFTKYHSSDIINDEFIEYVKNEVKYM